MSHPRYELLGPLRVWHGDAALPIGAAQQQTVLATLLLHANRSLRREQLIDAVWGETAPSYAVNLLQKHISGLRRALEPHRPHRAPARTLVWAGGGYQLNVADDSLDLHRFEHAVLHARQMQAAGDRDATAGQLRVALAMWRGTVCEGLSSPLLDAERDRLQERRIGLLEERIELDLAGGERQSLVTELHRLVAEYPFRERLRGLLMLALWRCGRSAEALITFREARRFLITELGVEPSEQLRQLHKRILDNDPALGGPSTATATGSATRPHRGPSSVVPAQLPAGIPDFIGRGSALAQLDELPHTSGQVPVAVIVGPAGVGKTALAVHWGHRAADRFEDGQLYVDLCGYAPHRPKAPTEAVREWVAALGVPAAAFPPDPSAQTALYRSLLAGRRMLLVLDNARDAAQVRPLLPGAPGCLVLVTSRHQLPGLVAAPGARPVTVDAWNDLEAREFMTRRLGHSRVAAEPQAVDEIVTRCAGLPLALSIIATRAALRPDFPLGSLADRLRETRYSLDAFTHDDQATDLRNVLSWSYRALTDAASAMLRSLSRHPYSEIEPATAAGLAGVTVPDAAAALAALARLHLLRETTPGRFQISDLIRVYADEQLHRDGRKPARDTGRSWTYGDLPVALADRGTVGQRLHTTNEGHGQRRTR